MTVRIRQLSKNMNIKKKKNKQIFKNINMKERKIFK
jgi:hypothetical protein